MHTFARPLAAVLLLSLALSGCSSVATTAAESSTSAPRSPSANPTPSVSADASAGASDDAAAEAEAEALARAAAEATAAAEAEAATQAAISAEPAGEVHAVERGGRIEIGAGHIKVESVNGQSSIETSYFGPSESLRDFLTQVFGVAPSVERSEAAGEAAAGTIYTWDGFVLSDPDALAESPESVDFSVQATASQVEGVSIEAAGGVQIGDSASQVTAQYPGGVSQFANDSGGTGVMVTGEVRELPTPADSAIRPLTHSVGFIATDQTAGITSIIAPQANFLH